MASLPTALAHHVLSEPHIAIRINIYPYTDSVQGFAKEMDVVPACGGFISHAFMYIVGSLDGVRERTGPANILATIAIALEAFVGYAHTLVDSIGAGMTEAAVIHVPAMQTRSP